MSDVPVCIRRRRGTWSTSYCGREDRIACLLLVPGKVVFCFLVDQNGLLKESLVR